MKQYDMKTYDTISEAYLGTLADVLDNPDYVCAPRGLPIREKLDYMFRVLHPTVEPIKTLDPERNAVIESYTKKEMDLYNSCSNRVEDFEKASKFWKHLANADGTINSAYGYLIWKNKSIGNMQFEGIMRTPWEYAIESLRKDKDTRQAILRFSLPEHQYMTNKDVTCTLSANFLIRDNKLHLSVVMRSNDLQKGLTYDAGFFISLIYRAIEELKDIYPDLTCGHYTHMSHSMHLYEKDVPTILKMLGR